MRNLFGATHIRADNGRYFTWLFPLFVGCRSDSYSIDGQYSGQQYPRDFQMSRPVPSLSKHHLEYHGRITSNAHDKILVAT